MVVGLVSKNFLKSNSDSNSNSNSNSNSQAEGYYNVFEELMVEHAPPLSAHLRVHGIACQMYLFNWLQSLFLQVGTGRYR